MYVLCVVEEVASHTDFGGTESVGRHKDYILNYVVYRRNGLRTNHDFLSVGIKEGQCE